MLSLAELGPAFRAAQHYRPGQLLAFGVDQAARRFERWSPVGLERLGSGLLAGRSVDLSFLQAWGRLSSCAALAPRWRPDAHGDPRTGVTRFVGVERTGWGVGDWGQGPPGSTLSELWLYNLHYFDVPAAGVAAQGIGPWEEWLTGRLASHWASQRAGRGVAWKPYPVAVRLQNLLRVWALSSVSPEGLSTALEDQLERHCRAATLHLAWRLEHQLGANHLLRELCALALGARTFGLRPLLALTRSAIEREVERQFGSAGGHEERSPSYHLELLRDLLELQFALGDEAPTGLSSVVSAGLDFSARIEHPDGDVPLFNDSQLDHGHSRDQLSALAGHVPVTEEGLWCFEDEGFVVARLGDGHLVVDCGRFGAPHQPAHAHCAALSFEYSWRGSRQVVNRGTMAYGEGPDRRATRGTAFHNTVQFGDLEQAELWRGFRMGRRNRPVLESARCSGGRVEIVGSLTWAQPGAPRHVRRFLLESDGELLVQDETSGAPIGAPPVSRFFLPQVAEVKLSVSGAETTSDNLALYSALGSPYPGRCVTVTPTTLTGKSETVSRWSTRIVPNRHLA